MLRFRPSTPSAGASSSDYHDGNEVASCSINDALDTLDTMKDAQNATDVSIAKSAATDLGHKMTSQFGKLDSLLNKADNATYTMKHQTDQMKKISK